MSIISSFLSEIPYKRVSNAMVKAGEHFDICKLGEFNNEILELVKLEAQSSYTPHYHEKSCAVIYMISGDGIFLLGGDKIPYQAEMRLDIPEKTLHGFITNTETVFLSIQSPPILNRQTGEVDLHYV